ncbi:MAG: hypothetical protein ACRBB5_00255 [Nitrosopumilus sp.]
MGIPSQHLSKNARFGSESLISSFPRSFTKIIMLKITKNIVVGIMINALAFIFQSPHIQVLKFLVMKSLQPNDKCDCHPFGHSALHPMSHNKNR